MQLPLKRAVQVIFVGALAAALSIVIYWGQVLKQQAFATWMHRAEDETARITEISMNWLSLIHSQLRGVAALFYGSELVTQDEFLDAIELIEGIEVEAVIPLNSLAYVRLHSSGGQPGKIDFKKSSLPVTLSSDAYGPLAIGVDLAGHPGIRTAILSAMALPGKMITGSAFKDEHGDTFITCALMTQNDGQPGVLISVINLSDLIRDFSILHIPNGLNLRLAECLNQADHTGDNFIIGMATASAQTVATAYIPMQSSQMRWDFYWDILPNFLGGPATQLGTVVQFGGSALILAVFSVIAVLLVRNSQVNKLVAERTGELVKVTQAAEAANQAKSSFLASMSHELRTPLNAILGYAQILLGEGGLNPRQKEQLNTIQNSGEHLLSLISDLLDIAKIESQKINVENAVFNFSSLIQELVSIIHTRADEKKLKFAFEELSPLPRSIRADKRKLRQVLLNLLDNAVKYTNQGSVIFRAGINDSAPQDRNAIQHTLHFEVEDTGIGIPIHMMELIFEPFTQVATNGKFAQGAGLGLAISRRLVDSMNGRIHGYSEPNKGSVFVFDLEIEVVEEPEPQIHEPEKTIVGYIGERKRILIVDDNFMNLAMLTAALEPLGFDIFTARDGRDSVARAMACSPDLILMDLLMPVQDGDEAVKQIRSDKHLCMKRIIGVSAAVADKERMKIFEDICDDFIPKPVQITKLMEKIRNQLDIQWIEEPSAS